LILVIGGFLIVGVLLHLVTFILCRFAKKYKKLDSSHGLNVLKEGMGAKSGGAATFYYF